MPFETFDKFQQATIEDLREETKSCFDKANKLGPYEWSLRLTAYTEAQFYMQELDRRDGARIADRDYKLEKWVIGLIGLEIVLSLLGIWLSIQQGVNEDLLMGKQNTILTNLQKSTSDTASTINGLLQMTNTMNGSAASTASTLRSLQSTTETMNGAIQGQLALFYEPSLNVVWNPGNHRVNVINNGRTNVQLWGYKLGSAPEVIDRASRVISPNAGFELEFTGFYPQMEQSLPKGNGTIVSTPLILYFTNEKQEEFCA